MIHRIVQVALRQRFLVLLLTLLVMVAGAVSFQRMPVDAYQLRRISRRRR